MPPGGETLVERATQQGWAIGLVVFILMVCILALTYLMKHFLTQAGEQNKRLHESYSEQLRQANDREARMAIRINELEKFTVEKLLSVIVDVTKAIDSMKTFMSGRPCLIDHKQHPATERQC